MAGIAAKPTSGDVVRKTAMSRQPLRASNSRWAMSALRFGLRHCELEAGV